MESLYQGLKESVGQKENREADICEGTLFSSDFMYEFDICMIIKTFELKVQRLLTPESPCDAGSFNTFWTSW